MTAMPNLSSSNLQIRSLIMSDLQMVHQILDIELNTANLGTEGCQTIAERQRWLEWTILSYEQLSKLNQPPYGERAIMHTSSQAMIGICGYVPCLDYFEQLCDFDQRDGTTTTKQSVTSTEFGLCYVIAKDFQGHGYAHEAVSAMIDFAFNQLRIERVIATTTYDNIPSIKVMRKLGMQLKKNTRDHPSWLQVVGMLNNPSPISQSIP